MVKTPSALKKAARQEREAAEEAEAVLADQPEEEDEGDASEQGDGEKKKRNRKVRTAKMRRDSQKKRSAEAIKLANAERDKMDKDDEAYHDRRIFVGNLPQATTREELRELFERFGTVHQARLTINSHGEFKGVGFVTFESAEEFEQACQVNGMEFKNQTLKVAKANPPPPKRDPIEVFVGGLPFTVEDKKVRKHFKECGEIKQVRMNIDHIKKKFNGTAFIKFKTPEAAKAAVKLHDTDFGGRKLFVKVALPKRKPIDTVGPEANEFQKASLRGEKKKARKAAKQAAEAAAEAEGGKAGGDAAGAEDSESKAKGKKRKVADEAAEVPEKKKKKQKKADA